MSASFWHGKRVLVTGHTGFKGSWLALWLRALGAEVAGFARPPHTEPNLFELARVAGAVESRFGDIADPAAVDDVFRHFRPQIVFHLAAQALVRASYADPVATYRTNVLGTVHVLDAVRRVPDCRALVNVTSDKCYENQEWCWPYRESDRLGGHDPYSSSKACAELVTAAYRNSFFGPQSEAGQRAGIATARAGNVIGGGDWSEDRLVPDLVRAFLSGRVAVVRNPGSIRPWQHVLDPLSGYLLLAQRLWNEGGDFAGPWNFGPPATEARTVGALVQDMAARWGCGADWQAPVPAASPQPHEARRLALDCSQAEARLGWAPVWGFEQAVDATVAWYQSYSQGENPSEICRRQIQRFGEDHDAAADARRAGPRVSAATR